MPLTDADVVTFVLAGCNAAEIAAYAGVRKMEARGRIRRAKKQAARRCANLKGGGMNSEDGEDKIRLPLILGRIKETREFYDRAAALALSAISLQRERLAVMVTKTGLLVADDTAKIDPRLHVLTINYRTDPDDLANCMKQVAFELGFDEGIRKGRKRACRD